MDKVEIITMLAVVVLVETMVLWYLISGIIKDADPKFVLKINGSMFSVGSKVKITYDGDNGIREKYARIVDSNDAYTTILSDGKLETIERGYIMFCDHNHGRMMPPPVNP